MLDRRNWAAIFFLKCIVPYGETSETRWRRPWFRTFDAASLVHPGLSSSISSSALVNITRATSGRKFN